MFKRTMTPGLAGGAALLLVLALSGVVAGANLVGDTASATKGLVNPTFEDTDGNGIDDDCQETVVADPEAEASAEAAVDTDGNGTISVSEAAHSDSIGGTNCNHGGYVSTVAHGADACDVPGLVTGPAPEETETGTGTETTAESDPDAETPETSEDGDEAACAEDPATETAKTDKVEKTCDATTEPAPEEVPTSVETTVVVRNGHGKAVSEVAKSDVVGGKNCNHGGAVSEAAHADKEARDAAKAEAKAARDAARAEAKAARDAARAEAKAARDAARAEAKAARQASKAAKAHGKHGG